MTLKASSDNTGDSMDNKQEELLPQGLGNRPLPELISSVADLVAETNKTVGQINDLILDLMSNGLEVSMVIDGKEIPIRLKFKVPS